MHMDLQVCPSVMPVSLSVCQSLHVVGFNVPTVGTFKPLSLYVFKYLFSLVIPSLVGGIVSAEYADL